MTIPADTLLDTPIASSYERIAFGKVNVRASEPLGERAYARFRFLAQLFDERLSAGRRTEIVASDDQDDPWYVTLFALAELPEGDFGRLADRFVLMSFKRRSEDDEGPVLALDARARWFAICPPEWISLRDARVEAEALMRAIVAQWGQLPEQADEYDLDYVASDDQLFDWLGLHRVITELTFWVSHTNPGGEFHPRQVWWGEWASMGAGTAGRLGEDRPDLPAGDRADPDGRAGYGRRDRRASPTLP